MDKYLSNNLTDRQMAVMGHIINVGGFDVDDVEYIKNEEYFDDPSSIDIAIFSPTKDFNYYLVSTVGLSSFQPDKTLARAELFMILPPSWKFDPEKDEYNWPMEMLKKVASGLVENGKGVNLYQVIQVSEDNFNKGTDSVGGVVCFPELNAIQFVEEKIEETYTRFFNFVPLNKAQISKIEDVGIKSFVEFDLHDADGPVNFVAKEPKIKKGSNIDRIIDHNVKSLNGKKGLKWGEF